MFGILTGTVSTADHQHDHISAEGNTYEEARAALDTLIPEGQQLIVIRTKVSPRRESGAWEVPQPAEG